MSLRIAPLPSHPSSTSNTNASQKLSSTSASASAPSAPGLPDTLRSPPHHQPQTTSANASSTHPLEARLAAWTATQQSLKHQLLARTYGIAEPVRREMELAIVREGDALPTAFGRTSTGNGIHEDILMGRDAEITWEDVYAGQDGSRREEGPAGEI